MELISRWRTVGWYYKLFLSVITLLIGAVIQFVNPADATFGLKAALLAVLAGGILFIEFLPTRNSPKGRLADFSNRFAGAVLALGVGWNWIASETDSTAWNQVGPYFYLIVYVALILSIAVFMEFAFKRQETGFNIEKAMDDLADEYGRLKNALEDDESSPDEIWGFIYATEITLANVLLYLWSDSNTELDASKLNIFWKYADAEGNDSPGSAAWQAHHRRLRKWVEGVSGRSDTGRGH